MEAITTSFASRRPAAGTLPAFSLPPPNAEIPRTTDGVSPSLSVHTAGSQASQQHSSNMHGYTYSAANSSANTNSNMPSSWSNGTYSASQQQQPHNPQPQQPLPQSPYGRQPMYGQPNMNFAPRTSQSPATGPEGIAAPPFDQVPQHYSHEAAHMSAPPQHSGILATHGASQPPPASSLAAHSDAYAHTRPGSDPSYYTTSAPPQFSSYPPQHSPQTSPTTGSPGARLPNNSMSGYRPPHYPSYGQLPTMGGTVMSNMHQPGSQMSMMPGMAQGYNGHMVYGHHAQPPPQSERPFKCDQCVQSFSRNHDLKRHKRIHLSVKPFPCNFCSKSFSRKDALKRHRLVKGCEKSAAERAAEAQRTEERGRE